MEAEVQIGPAQYADGSVQAARGERTGAVCVTDTHGHFTEAVSRGTVFSAALTTGLAPGTAGGTAAALGLWNPTSSGVNLAILWVWFAWASGTLGAGKMWHVLHNASIATPGGTLIAPFSNKGAATGAKAQAYSSATGLGVQNLVAIMATVTALSADAGTGAPIYEYVDGRYVVPPGQGYSLQEVGGAGSTPLCFFGYTWEEIPL